MSEQKNPEEPDNDKKPTPNALSGAWIAIGAGVGVAIGAATDNIGLWVAIGVAIGVAIMAGQTYSTRDK